MVSTQFWAAASRGLPLLDEVLLVLEVPLVLDVLEDELPLPDELVVDEEDDALELPVCDPLLVDVELAPGAPPVLPVVVAPPVPAVPVAPPAPAGGSSSTWRSLAPVMTLHPAPSARPTSRTAIVARIVAAYRPSTGGQSIPLARE